MTLTKAQRAVLAEMVRTGQRLLYDGGICKIGDRVTTVQLRRALLEAELVALAHTGTPTFGVPCVLTDAGRTEGERALAAMGLCAVRLGSLRRRRAATMRRAGAIRVAGH